MPYGRSWTGIFGQNQASCMLHDGWMTDDPSTAVSIEAQVSRFKAGYEHVVTKAGRTDFRVATALTKGSGDAAYASHRSGQDLLMA